MKIKSKHDFNIKYPSATCFGYKSHVEAKHILVVGNIYYSAINDMDEISSHINMDVLKM
jgi:hypothetical protein